MTTCSLVEEVLRACDECKTRVKLEKCEFMQEEINYLGFQFGWRWWRPVKENVAPVLKATIRDDNPVTSRTSELS